MVAENDPCVYVSYDHGISWSVLSEVPFSNGIKGVEVQEDGDLFVSTTYSEIWRFSDNLKWEYLKTISGSYINLQSVDNDVLFYSVYGETYRSVNNGNDWQLIEQGYFNDVAIHELYAHPDGTLYKLDGWDDILYSEDKGDSWDFLSYKRLFRMDESGIMYSSKSISSERTIMRSVNKGATWSDYITLPNNEFSNIQIIDFCVQGNDLFIYANDLRVYKYSISNNLLTRSEEAENYFYLRHMMVTKNGTVLLWDQNDLIYNLTFSEM